MDDLNGIQRIFIRLAKERGCVSLLDNTFFKRMKYDFMSYPRAIRFRRKQRKQKEKFINEWSRYTIDLEVWLRKTVYKTFIDKLSDKEKEQIQEVVSIDEVIEYYSRNRCNVFAPITSYLTVVKQRPSIWDLYRIDMLWETRKTRLTNTFLKKQCEKKEV